MKINIKNAKKEEVLAALYNSSHPQGMGFLHYDPAPMTPSEATQHLCGYVDYLKGRVIKIKLSSDILDPSLYDRDNGPGAAAAALRNVKGVTFE